MSVETDPGIWKQVSGWLWALLMLPVGMIWKKADSALPRADFDAAMAKHREENREEHRDFRDTMRELYKNAESDRKDVSARLETMNREMHEMHVELLNKVGERK